MRKLAALCCLAMFCAVGCVDRTEPSTSEPTVSPQELRSIKPLDTPAPLELETTARVCASFDKRQADLDCYADDLGFICCTYQCPRCNIPPSV